MRKSVKKVNNNNLKVSIIIPCLNEAKYITKCLDSLIVQDYPIDNFEILVVDGISSDNTVEVIKSYNEKPLSIKIFKNPKKITPCAFNIGIQFSKADIIMIVSAHSSYERNYISKCIKYLKKFKVDNVGGVLIALPGADGILANSISFVLSHPFGVGNAFYRIGTKEPKYVETVFGGCFKKDIFKKIGLFNENLIRNQDIEFNLRLKKSGGGILLVPDIKSYYYARSTLNAFTKNNFSNGFWIVYSTKFAKMPFSIRHLIPFFFILSVCGSLILSFIYRPFLFLFSLILISYFMLNLFFSFRVSFKKGFKYLFPVMISFCALHFSYGFGSMWGLIKLASRHIHTIN